MLGKILVAVHFVLIVSAWPKCASSQDLQEKVIAEILKSHKELNDRFQPTKVVSSFDEREAPGSPVVSRQAEFFRSGYSVLAKTQLELWAANEKYEFHLRRNSPAAEWTIAELVPVTPGRKGDLSSVETVTALGRNNLQEFLVANHIPLAELFNHPHIHMASFSDSGDGEDRIVRAEFTVDDPTAKLQNGLEIRFARISLQFTPEETGWIPTRIELSGPTGDGITKLQSGFVKLGEDLVPRELKNVGRLTDGTEWELSTGITEYGFDPIPSEVFYLTHYGLPEPSGSRQSLYRLWVMLALAAFLGGALGFISWNRVVK